MTSLERLRELAGIEDATKPFTIKEYMVGNNKPFVSQGDATYVVDAVEQALHKSVVKIEIIKSS